jgi:hypothetical protein
VALTAPSAGDTFTLAVDHGEGVGALVAGSAIEVIDVVDPGTPGTGDNVGEPVIIFAVWESSTVLDDNDRSPIEGIAVRHLSRPLSDFKRLAV